MNRLQDMVGDFNWAIKAQRGDKPELRAHELRARLILEEAFETAEAILGCDDAIRVTHEILIKREDEAPKCEYPDMVEAIDGLCDLLYVTFGAFDAFGVDAEPFFSLVHEANLTKLSGPVDEHGKRLKPPGFVPPNEAIRALLVKMGAKL